MSRSIANHIAQVTGLTTNAKLIGHVPVDQGVSAQTFIKKRASRIAAKAAAEASAKKSSTSASDESDDESGMRPRRARARARIGLDEIFDPDEDWIDWEEEESKSNSSKGNKEQRRLPARTIIRIGQPRRMILYPIRQHIGDEVFHCKTGIYNHNGGRDIGIQ